MSLPENTLKITLRGKHRRPCGMVVAIKSKNKPGYAVGWSMAHRGLDEYNELVGRELALTRAADAAKLKQVMILPITEVPHTVASAIQKKDFLRRCEAYFNKKSRSSKKVAVKSKK